MVAIGGTGSADQDHGAGCGRTGHGHGGTTSRMLGEVTPLLVPEMAAADAKAPASCPTSSFATSTLWTSRR